MGRVDDAMRRAAGQTPPHSGNATAAAVAEAPESEPVAERRPEAQPKKVSMTPTAARALTFDRIAPPFAEKTVIDQKMHPGIRDQYRRLAATLHHAHAGGAMKVIMIASAVAGEGKTLTAANLSLTLSESYQRSVLLIDADLRRPSLHKVFSIQGAPGLSEGLTAGDERKLPIFQLSPYLSVLPAGTPTSDPTAGLTSARMRNLIEEGRHAFDWIVIDTPPVGLLTDANLIASMVDGVVLVVHAGATPHDLVSRAVKAIGPERMLGVVLNRAETSSRKYGYYHYDYYGTHHPASEPQPAPAP